MGELSEEQVVWRGKKRTIAFAVDESGGMPAKAFLELLGKNRQERHKRSLARARHLFQVMADHGEIKNKQKFKRVRDSVYAFKDDQLRVTAFQDGNVWYLLTGFIKKRDRWPKREIDRANRMVSQITKKGRNK
jgi:Gp49-like protein DUF891